MMDNMELTPFFNSNMLKAMMPRLPTNKQGEYFGPLHRTLLDNDIRSIHRMAAAIAQIGHETYDLKYWKEPPSKWNKWYAAYEKRRDLGNTEQGDGARYPGRSPIHTTGKKNYGLFGAWAYERGLVPRPDYYIENPELLETPEHGFPSFIWYWETKELSRYADTYAITEDKVDFDKIGYLINVNGDAGNLNELNIVDVGNMFDACTFNGRQDRWERFERCLKVFTAGAPAYG